MQNRGQRIESLECVYEAIFTLTLMPFVFVAMNQVFEGALMGYLSTAFLSLCIFGLCLLANKHLFRPLCKKFITHLDKYFEQ